jgi:hypothetical protein
LLEKVGEALSGTNREQSKGENIKIVEERERGTTWVNIAKAVQEAVVALDPDQTEPLLTWAGFVLHGFWMFAVEGMDSVA